MPLPDPNRPSGPRPAPNTGMQNLPQGQSAAPPRMPSRAAASRGIPSDVPPLPGSNAAAGLTGTTPPSPSPPSQGNAPSFNTRHLLWLVLAAVVLLGLLGIAGGAWLVLKIRDSGRKVVGGDRTHNVVAPLPAEGSRGTAISPPAKTAEPQRSPAGSQIAALPAIGSSCQGVFSYNDPMRPHRTTFSLTFNDVSEPDATTGQARIAGTMNEPRIDFGPPSMKTLPSTFSGTWTPSPQAARIVFTKTYTFDSPPSEFVGTYDPTTRTVSGTWNLNGYTGAFTLMGVTTR